MQLCQSHLIPIFRLEERLRMRQERTRGNVKLMEASLATEPATDYQLVTRS